MKRPFRLLLPCLVAVFGLVLSGCGDKEDLRTVGETEGLYLDLAGLTYQVQLSRYMNEADIEDTAYLQGLPTGVSPGDRETWFGVFIRVQNEGVEPHETASRYEIHTTQGKVFRPVPLDEKANAFAFRSRVLAPGEIIPNPDSAAGNGPVQGELLLYRIDYESLQNRPLELRIHSPENPDEVAIVDLDV